MGASLTKVKPEQRDIAVMEVETQMVGCDGGGGPLGHPLTYYDLGPEGEAVCGYCGKVFRRKR